MSKARKKAPREKDLTARLLAGDEETDRLDVNQRFSERSEQAQHRKMQRTAVLRAADEVEVPDIETLPLGQVVQVYSLFCNVEVAGELFLCVVRKTMARLGASAIVVGDFVRIRPGGTTDDHGRPLAVIEQAIPRRTVLTRTDSFKGIAQQPIVANADQVLIVATVREPNIKWGLIDRMVVAARAGGLRPVLCLNKVDLDRGPGDADYAFASQALAHYATLGVEVLKTSAATGQGLDQLREILAGKTTVLAGHSGVGKSSLVRAIQPALDIRTAPLSGYTGKGRHTTTSARRYLLDFDPTRGGQIIDTPGVKLFGLWNVNRDNLSSYFEDVAQGHAPQWRIDSYQRILESLGPT